MYEAGVEEVEEYSLRFEYQGRGTLHVHVVAWMRFRPTSLSSVDPTDCQAEAVIRRRQNTCSSNSRKRLVMLPATCISATGTHCLLLYVTGYDSKA